MPIDAKAYGIAKEEFAEFLSRFPKNRELEQAYRLFCDPSYPRPLIAGEGGAAFRRRQRMAEEHFDELVGALRLAMRTADADGAERLARGVIKWQEEKNKSGFQDNFEEFKEGFMPHEIKEQLAGLFDQTIATVNSFCKSLEGYAAEANTTVTEQELSYYREVAERLTGLREKLGQAEITDTAKSLEGAEEIRRCLASLRSKLPSGIPGRRRVLDELDSVEEAFGPGPRTILALPGKPVGDRRKALQPFAEIGREHNTVVKNVDELEAAQFVLGTLRHYNDFLNDIMQKLVGLIDRRSSADIGKDPVVAAAYRRYKELFDRVKAIGPNSSQYNYYVKEMLKAKAFCESEVETRKRQLEMENRATDDEVKLLASVQREFSDAVRYLLSDVFGNYRQRYRRIVENGIYDLDELYDELRDAISSNSPKRILDVRARITYIIQKLTVSISKEAVIDVSEPIPEDPAIYARQHAAEEPIIAPELLVDDLAWLGGEQTPELREPRTASDEVAVTDGTAQHVNVDPVEETGNVDLDTIIRRIDNTDK